MTTPIKKKLIANSVNTPSTSAPRIKRRTTSKTNSAAEPADNNKPANDSHCNGATENPVTRSIASKTLIMRDLDFGWILCEGITERRNKDIGLAIGVHPVHDAPAVTAQHATVVGEPDMRNPFAQPVHEARCLMPPYTAPPLRANRPDIVVARAHLLNHFANFFRRVFQISVERNDFFSARCFKARQQRRVLAMILVQ